MGMLDNTVALVTGAGNGIGQAIALDLASQGASVVVNDLGGDRHGDGADASPAARTAAAIVAAGGSAVADHGSVSDTAAAEAMVQLAVDTYGSLNIVVNVAGILRDAMLTSMSDEQWDAIMAVHLRGHFAVTRAAARHWRAAAKAAGGPIYGRVLHFTSEAGLYGNVGQTNYSAAKGGIASFGITAASELGRYGVTSNVIAPRARTRLTEDLIGDAAPKLDGYDPWDPSFIAPVVSYLASEAGGRFSGQILVAGGGLVQTVQPYVVDHSVEFADAPPTHAELDGLLSTARGERPGPPPTATELILSNLAPAQPQHQ